MLSAIRVILGVELCREEPLGGKMTSSRVHIEQVMSWSKTPAGGSERRGAVRSETRLFRADAA